jgi:hypothetical protein
MTERIFYHGDSTELRIETGVGPRMICFQAYHVLAGAILPEKFFDSKLADYFDINNEDVELNLIVRYKIEDGELTQQNTVEVVGGEHIGCMASSMDELVEQVDWTKFPATDEEVLKKAQEEIERQEKNTDGSKKLVAALSKLLQKTSPE